MNEISKAPRAVRIWLWVGLVMVFLQIAIGGVTRLTGSGLSITRWEIVIGTFPPMSAAAWDAAFDLYKATPQYEKINQGMSMSEFKFIYFWEYFHRLWARLMGFVFIIPFFWFWRRGMLSPTIRRRLLILVSLAALEGFFGWIMVASGLRDRPWVNAYNLTLHLTMGVFIFSWLLWTIFIAHRPVSASSAERPQMRFSWGVVTLIFVQIALGAMMSGSKAGLFFPTWPDMSGVYFPGILLDAGNWQWIHFFDYDKNPFMPALIQFLHRNVAYILTGLTIWWIWRTRGLNSAAVDYALFGALVLQVLLGIVTVLHCRSEIPVFWGSAHQIGAILLLSIALYKTYALGMFFSLFLRR